MASIDTLRLRKGWFYHPGARVFHTNCGFAAYYPAPRAHTAGRRTPSSAREHAVFSIVPRVIVLWAWRMAGCQGRKNCVENWHGEKVWRGIAANRSGCTYSWQLECHANCKMRGPKSVFSDSGCVVTKVVLPMTEDIAALSHLVMFGPGTLATSDFVFLDFNYLYSSCIPANGSFSR
jgi:hypothetical protein